MYISSFINLCPHWQITSQASPPPLLCPAGRRTVCFTHTRRSLRRHRRWSVVSADAAAAATSIPIAAAAAIISVFLLSLSLGFHWTLTLLFLSIAYESKSLSTRLYFWCLASFYVHIDCVMHANISKWWHLRSETMLRGPNPCRLLPRKPMERGWVL